MGLDPFKVLETPLDEVMRIYVDCIIYENNKKKTSNKEAQWVTSANATWH